MMVYGGLTGRGPDTDEPIATLFSPVNAEFEARAAEIIAAQLPDVAISLSHEIGRIGLLEFQGKRPKRWAEVWVHLHRPLQALLLAVTILRQAYPEPVPGMAIVGIKGQGSVWEGQGLPLYRPDVWVNFDGQSRWFPSR